MDPEDAQNILTNMTGLKSFFNSENEVKNEILHKAHPNFHKGLKSLVHVIPHFFHPKHREDFLKGHHKFYNHIRKSRGHPQIKKSLIDSHVISGGSIFSRIGHAFHHLGHLITHTAKAAVSGVSHLAHEAIHGATHVGERIANEAKKDYGKVKAVEEAIVHQVNEGLDAAKDFITTYGPDIVKKALPYLEKAQNYALNAVAPGAGTALGLVETHYVNNKIDNALGKGIDRRRYYE